MLFIAAAVFKSMQPFVTMSYKIMDGSPLHPIALSGSKMAAVTSVPNSEDRLQVATSYDVDFFQILRVFGGWKAISSKALLQIKVPEDVLFRPKHFFKIVVINTKMSLYLFIINLQRVITQNLDTIKCRYQKVSKSLTTFCYREIAGKGTAGHILNVLYLLYLTALALSE